MPVVVWNDSYLLGIERFDQHHKHLVGLLNATYDAFNAGTTIGKIESVLQELIDYSAYHFTSEERSMSECSYPGLARHKEEHERFIRRITEMDFDFRKVSKDVSLDIILFLKEWLINHILKSDAEYGVFFNSQQSAAEMKQQYSHPIQCASA
jgi:hemerythrin